MINYLVAWLGCAKQHGLTIDYLGGWNERGYNTTWYEQPARALNSNGYGSVKIVASDDFGWGTANDVRRDPAFAAAVSRPRLALRLRLPQRADQLPELRQRGRHREAAVGQRERLGRLQRRRERAWPAASTAATSTAR